MRKFFVLLAIAALATMAFATAASAAPGGEPGPRPGFGELYHDGDLVRTIVPPAANPNIGVDDLFVVEGQTPVAAVAPGDADYHGGKWAVNGVEWNTGVTPYLLTSADDVHQAAASGDVTITRVAAMDFKRPIQP